jgi:hypothetical protein
MLELWRIFERSLNHFYAMILPLHHAFRQLPTIVVIAREYGGVLSVESDADELSGSGDGDSSCSLLLHDVM